MANNINLFNEFRFICKNNGTNDKFIEKVTFLRYVMWKGLNLGLKARKLFHNQNHTENWALGSHPRDNGHVSH